MTGKEFIQEYLIDGIGDLVETKPFFAFTLMAVGIEFLGKCLNANLWDTRHENGIVPDSHNVFEDALKTYESLKKYDGIDLYHNLRCGLAHFLMVKKSIELGPDHNDFDGSNREVGCREFYDDFVQACKDALVNRDRIIQKNLDEPFCEISPDGITGSTISHLSN